MVDRIGLLISDNYGDYRVAPVSAPYDDCLGNLRIRVNLTFTQLIHANIGKERFRGSYHKEDEDCIMSALMPETGKGDVR